MNNNPLISIIVPVFNTEEYLDRCIKSLLSQSYNNIEIILVDDGSTDTSSDICDYYNSQFDNIIVKHKTNGGQISARKLGIACSNGDYISFIDSDDWIEKNMLSSLVEQNIDCSADIIAFGCVEDYVSRSNVLTNVLSDGMYGRKWIQSHREELFITDNFFSWSILPHLCDKLIKRSLIQDAINNVPDGILFGEDVASVFPCIQCADSLLIVNKPYYHYVQRQGSIVKSYDELPNENFQGLYRTLSKGFCGSKRLMVQLKEYLFFTLMLKRYSSLNSIMPLYPFTKVKNNDRVFVYCAGGFGNIIKMALETSQTLSFAGWSDSNYRNPEYSNQGVLQPEHIAQENFDKLVITILNEKAAVNIKNYLIGLGISDSKIDYVRKEVIDESELPEWVYE